MNINLEELKKEYINGVFFTKPSLDGKSFLLTKQFDTKDHDFPTFVYKILTLTPSNIDYVKRKDFSKLQVEDVKVKNLDRKTTFSKNGVLVDTTFVNDEDNEVGRMEVIKKKDGNYHLILLQVSRNYREYGFSGTFIETLKTFAHVNNVKQVTGLLCPLDKLVYKDVLYPAKHFPPMTLRPFNDTEDENFDGVKSANVLEKIYRNLGFSVDRDRTQEIGRLYLNTKDVNQDFNYLSLKENLCLKENFFTGSKTIKPNPINIVINNIKSNNENSENNEDFSDYLLPNYENEENITDYDSMEI